MLLCEKMNRIRCGSSRMKDEKGGVQMKILRWRLVPPLKSFQQPFPTHFVHCDSHTWSISLCFQQYSASTSRWSTLQPWSKSRIQCLIVLLLLNILYSLLLSDSLGLWNRRSFKASLSDTAHHAMALQARLILFVTFHVMTFCDNILHGRVVPPRIAKIRSRITEAPMRHECAHHVHRHLSNGGPTAFWLQGSIALQNCIASSNTVAMCKWRYFLDCRPAKSGWNNVSCPDSPDQGHRGATDVTPAIMENIAALCSLGVQAAPKAMEHLSVQPCSIVSIEVL